MESRTVPFSSISIPLLVLVVNAVDALGLPDVRFAVPSSVRIRARSLNPTGGHTPFVGAEILERVLASVPRGPLAAGDGPNQSRDLVAAIVFRLDRTLPGLVARRTGSCRPRLDRVAYECPLGGAVVVLGPGRTTDSACRQPGSLTRCETTKSSFLTSEGESAAVPSLQSATSSERSTVPVRGQHHKGVPKALVYLIVPGD